MHRLLVIGVTGLVSLALSGGAAAWSWPADGDVLRGFALDGAYAAGQHRGIDVAGPEGAAVRAPASGTVTFAGALPTYGRGVTILTSDGYSVTLVHLGSIGVVKGDDVAEGAVVGTMGWSGEPEHAVPTVHLGIRVAARSEGYVDPAGLLPPRGPAPAPARPSPAPAPAPAAQAPTSAPAPTPAPAPAPAPSSPGRIDPGAAGSTTANAGTAANVTPVMPASPPAGDPPRQGSAASSTSSGDGDSLSAASRSAPQAGIVVGDGSGLSVRSAPPSATVGPVALAASGATARAGHADRPRAASVPLRRRSASVASSALVGIDPVRAPGVDRVAPEVLSEVPGVSASVARRAPGLLTAPEDDAAARLDVNARATTRGPTGAAGTVTPRATRPPRAAAPTAAPTVAPVAAAGAAHDGGAGGVDPLTIAAAVVLLALLALAAARRVARRIAGDGAVLRHDADLLRELHAAHRARVHDRGRGRLRTPSAPARP